MKIAFYLENRDIPDVDLSRPEWGNPGCGGTEFLFVALPFYLGKLHGNTIQPVILGNATEHLPNSLEVHQVQDIRQAAHKAKELDCSFFVYRPRRAEEEGLHDLLHTLALPSIAWLHVTPLDNHLRTLGRKTHIKAVVCVEHEQHEALRDTLVTHKLTYIVNGFDSDNFQLRGKPTKDPNLVVYLGALVSQKGFHLLAQAWPQVVNRRPEAKLAVIGSGALYNTQAQLGSWGVAEAAYEEFYIKPYLHAADGGPPPSVNFLGRLGQEKKEWLHRAAVGVVNPSGQSENCPGSALEFQACGTPVVSGAFYGMLDTVRHNETGLLGRTVNDLAMNICRLLEDAELSRRMGQNGKAFVRERYDFSAVTRQWADLFNRLAEGEKPILAPHKKNIFRHAKWLVYLNQFFQRSVGRYLWWPSTLELKEFVKATLKKLHSRRKA